MNGGEINRP